MATTKKKATPAKTEETAGKQSAAAKRVAKPEEFGAVDRGEGSYTEEARDQWARANSDAVEMGAPKQNGIDNNAKNTQNRKV